MKKKTLKFIVYLLVVVVLIMAVLLVRNNAKNTIDTITKEETNVSVKKENKPDIKNMIYDIEGEIFKLKNGKAENPPVEGFVTGSSLILFGEPKYGDLDGDKDEDSALWFVNDGGGTGKFYYAVLVMNNNGVFKPTNAVFLGDRIAPQTLEIQNGRAVYNFADRKSDDPMTALPSVGKSVWIKYDKQTGEIGV